MFSVASLRPGLSRPSAVRVTHATRRTGLVARREARLGDQLGGGAGPEADWQVRKFGF